MCVWGGLLGSCGGGWLEGELIAVWLLVLCALARYLVRGLRRWCVRVVCVLAFRVYV